ncbi:outer membrane lipoprotein-sorting protein [Bacteroidota bacterium]
MKTIKSKIILLLAGLIIFPVINAQNLTGKDIIKKADEKMQGESNISVFDITIVRPAWTRTLTVKTWSRGREYSLALITAPVKEKGQTFLRRENDMWNWLPKIERMVKLPPSMMSQGWMGSDFSNDDLLKESSIVVDYNQNIIGNETIEGMDCYKIELLPLEDAAVVWGKIIKWISKDEYLQLKSEYYDEDEYLIRTEFASDIKIMDGRLIPTHMELIPEEKEGHKTLVDIKSVQFNTALNDNFFSQQNMKRIR